MSDWLVPLLFDTTFGNSRFVPFFTFQCIIVVTDKCGFTLQKYSYTRIDNIYIFFLVVMMVKTILKEFCQNTSIHGLSSIVETKSSLIKRFAWFVIFVISISYAGIQLKDNVDSKLP